MRLTPETIIAYVTDRCDACDGAGETYRLRCRRRDRTFTRKEYDSAWAAYKRLRDVDPWSAGMDAVTMPCGHTFDDVRDVDPCGECEGDGFRSYPVTLAELAAALKGC